MHSLDSSSESLFINADGAPHDCVYLPDQVAKLAYVYPRARLSEPQFDQQLALGQRRSGPFLYYMKCENCRACQPTRLLVPEFEMTTSMRRVKNRGDAAITCQWSPAGLDYRRVDLYNMHRLMRGLGDDGSIAGVHEYREFLVDSCCDTMELSYFVDGKLIGCTIVDVGHESISAVYTYFDPQHSRLSVGTYAVLKLVEYARAREMRYVYLGLYVAANPHLKYKARFAPQERLIHGQWVRFDAASEDWSDSSVQHKIPPRED